MKLSSSSYLADSSSLLSELKSRFQKVFWYFGKHAFLFILIFVLLSIIFAETLFFNYIISVNKESESTAVGTKFNKDIYDSVLKKWEERKNIFEDYTRNDYLNPFR